MTSSFRRIALGLCLVACALPGLAAAQGLFSPAITVNDKVITRFEVEQRARMLQLFRAPGDAQKLAREQLIEDRLKMEAAEAAGIDVTTEGIDAGMEEFAARANLSREQFVAALSGGGVSEETFRDFVRTGVLWRELVRARFVARVQITEAEVDKAMAAVTGDASVRVLLSEIIMPAPPPQAQAVMARAERISQITSIDAFSAEARRYSATPSRGRGGRLDWMPLTQLPPALRPIILGLAPGQVTDPLPLENAVALFQLRAIEETDSPAPDYAAIEYAAYYIAGGRSDAALAQAQRLRDSVDNCDDLYGFAKGQPEEVLERGAKAPGEIPRDIAIELAKLDPGEISTALTRADGQTRVVLMLCGRTPEIGEELDREEVRLRLQNQRLESLANGFLAQLKADARIVTQ